MELYGLEAEKSRRGSVSSMMFFTHNSHHEVAPRVRSEFVGVYVAFSLDRNNRKE